MKQVDVYGADHSPWVQAVLLGLHDGGIPHSLTSLPPLETFRKSGVMMPAARIDGGRWQLESAEILRDVGFGSITDEHPAQCTVLSFRITTNLLWRQVRVILSSCTRAGIALLSRRFGNS